MIGIGATLFKRAVMGSRGFSPSALFANGEEGGWYDPSKLSSMKQNSDGTVDAVVDSPVGYIEDQSGNGNTAIQATSDKRPTLRQAGSLYYLEFDGANDCLATSAIDFTGGDQMSVFAGAAKTASTNQIVAELSSSVSSNNGSFRLFGSSTIWRYTSKGTSLVNGSASDYGIPSTSVLSATSDISADQLTFNVNGDQEANPTSNQGTGNYGNYALNIGSRNNGASLPLTGNIYGLVVRSAVSSAAEIAATEAYMATKSGITL
tara:strand:- start:251 stop:1036 length:786 start_codon:yes stop_codon:yes gene_type:complete